MARWRILRLAAIILTTFFVLTGCVQTIGQSTDRAERTSSEVTDRKSGEPQDTVEEAFIEKAREMGLFKLDSDGSFHPDENTTYAKFAFALWVLSGKPNLSEKEPPSNLSGLSADEYSAFLWCTQSVLADTTEPDALLAETSVTRLEAMNILFRHQGGTVGIEGLLAEVYNDLIQDSAEIAESGKDGFYWGIYHELIACTPTMESNPNGILSNGQTARILVKYAERFLDS